MLFFEKITIEPELLLQPSFFEGSGGSIITIINTNTTTTCLLITILIKLKLFFLNHLNELPILLLLLFSSFFFSLTIRIIVIKSKLFFGSSCEFGFLSFCFFSHLDVIQKGETFFGPLFGPLFGQTSFKDVHKMTLFLSSSFSSFAIFFAKTLAYL